MNMIDYLLFDRTFALIFYGALITVASGIGIACGKVCKQEMVMWMAFSWIGDNWLFLQVPIDRAAVAMTVFNALLTLPMAAIAIRYKCRTSADIVGLRPEFWGGSTRRGERRGDESLVVRGSEPDFRRAFTLGGDHGWHGNITKD